MKKQTNITKIKKKDEPDYAEVIRKFKQVIVINPSDPDEKKLSCIANLKIGDMIDGIRSDERKISSDSIEYYEKAVEGFEELIRDMRAQLVKIEGIGSPLVLNTTPQGAVKNEKQLEKIEKIKSIISEFQFRVGVILLAIGQIRQDQLNTQKSVLNTQLSKNEDPDPKKDLEKAIDFFNKIEPKEKPKKILIFNNLAVTNFTLYEISFKRDYLSNALYYFNLSVEIDIDENNNEEKDAHYLAKYNKGFALYREKRFAEAKDNFYERYKYNEDVLASAHIADIFLNLKDYDSALEFYKKVLDKHNGKSPYALNGIALCNLYKANFKLADTCATESLELLRMHKLLKIDEDIQFKEIDEYTIVVKQSIVESLLIIATAQLRLENRNGALPFIRKAKEIIDNYNLGFIGASFLHGIMLMEENKFKAAKAIFENILLSKKDYAEVYAALGICHYNTGDTEGAIEKIKKSTELQPDLTSAQISLSRIEAYKNRSF